MDASTAAIPKPKPKRVRPPKPRTPALRRGKACLNCRHLKIRCDGVQPACNNCVRVPKDDPCIYNTPRSSRRSSPNTDSACCSPLVDLAHLTASPSALQDFSLPGYFTPESYTCDIYSEAYSDSSCSDFESQEPNTETVALLLQHFLPQSEQLGFFLHIDRFRTAALTPPVILPGLESFNHLFRPTESLLFAVYLWGAHLAGTHDPLHTLKDHFLTRAIQSISTDICLLTRDTTHAVQTIQAHVLLANYFLANAQVMAARVQASAAATLATGYNLHRLGMSRADSDPEIVGFQGMGMMGTACTGNDGPGHLRLSQDAIEEGEWIRAFWAVIGLQTSLRLVEESVNNGSPASASPCMQTSTDIMQSLEREINTPWPMHMYAYEMQLGRESSREEPVVAKLLSSDNASSDSVAAHAQAGVLFSLASRLATTCAGADKTQLASRIAQFLTALPTLSTDPEPNLAGAHALASAAALILQRSDPDAEQTSIQAAQSLLHVLWLSFPTSPSSSCGSYLLNPAASTLAALACAVFSDAMHASRLRQFLFGPQTPAQDGAGLEVYLQEGMHVLAACASTTAGSLLAESQLAEVRRDYAALCGAL
ncbi:Zn(2)-C6 fungal-type domain-containing protein [Mycena kentingensis (nom. inval.)]|nr:Zn(2)-C6 fungal-type domain-containing protein [Mycena kentingensis (nom. inval.)]